MRWLMDILSPLLFLFCEAAMAVEEPRYTVLAADPPFEVRRYAAFTVAQTQINGDFDAASRSGLQAHCVLHLWRQPASRPGRAAQNFHDRARHRWCPKTEGWRMHFVMPSAESLQTLPQPLNPQIQLRPVPEHETVAVRFSGITTASEHPGANRAPAGLGAGTPTSSSAPPPKSPATTTPSPCPGTGATRS
jgi:hypothetical protein